jgi:hypothetical protein
MAEQLGSTSFNTTWPDVVASPHATTKGRIARPADEFASGAFSIEWTWFGELGPSACKRLAEHSGRIILWSDDGRAQASCITELQRLAAAASATTAPAVFTASATATDVTAAGVVVSPTAPARASPTAPAVSTPSSATTACKAASLAKRLGSNLALGS